MRRGEVIETGNKNDDIIPQNTVPSETNRKERGIIFINLDITMVTKLLL